MRTIFALYCAFLLTTSLRAVQTYIPPDLKRGTYLGVLFSAIPEAVLDHLPLLPRTGGVMVTHVLPKSPAATAGLKRHDILLLYNNIKIRDGNHFAEMISHDRPNTTIALGLIRKGKQLEIKVTLKLGPVLRIAKAEPQSSKDNPPPRGIAKQGGPGKINVSAVPMDGNRMRVTFEYYHTGRLKQVTCSGTPDAIDEQVKAKLPDKVQPIAQAAIQRLRELEFQKQAQKPHPDSE